MSAPPEHEYNENFGRNMQIVVGVAAVVMIAVLLPLCFSKAPKLEWRVPAQPGYAVDSGSFGGGSGMRRNRSGRYRSSSSFGQETVGHPERAPSVERQQRRISGGRAQQQPHLQKISLERRSDENGELSDGDADSSHHSSHSNNDDDDNKNDIEEGVVGSDEGNENDEEKKGSSETEEEEKQQS